MPVRLAPTLSADGTVCYTAVLSQGGRVFGLPSRSLMRSLERTNFRVSFHKDDSEKSSLAISNVLTEAGSGIFFCAAAVR